MNRRDPIAKGERAVPAASWTRRAIIVGSLGVGTIILAGQAIFISNRLNAGALDPEFCAPGLLHTTVELPETQLTRDFLAIRLLLKDPSDHFEVIRMLYEGELQAPELRQTAAWLSKRSGRGRLEFSKAPMPTLKKEAARIDVERVSKLDSSISHSLSSRNRAELEAAFRRLFAVLLDELLTSISRQIDDPTTASRLFPHARRYYTEALEAHLLLQHPSEATTASNSLTAMSRALEAAGASPTSAKEWFEKERARFMGSINAAANQT
jgi:hypothetical protein